MRIFYRCCYAECAQNAGAVESPSILTAILNEFK